MTLSRNTQSIMRISRSAALLLIMVLSGTVVARADKPWSERLVYKGATDIKVYSGLKSELDYRVIAAFPPSPVDNWLSHELRNAGWTKLGYDFFNPRTSLDISWQRFWDRTNNPTVCVHQEFRDWRKANGDFLRYVLRYKSPTCETSDLKELDVMIFYYPAKMARIVEDAIKSDDLHPTP
jgi:hypothetical protein